MYTGLIANRYAKALAAYAAAGGEERRTYDEVKRLIGYYREDATLREALFSPVLSAEKKLGFVCRSFGGRPCAALEAFIRLVLRHHREHYLYFMLYSYRGLYKERHNIRDAVLQTAAPVGEEFVERLCRVAEARTHSEVHIRREVHPELVGGFVFRIDDVLIDASLAAQLKLLRRKLGSKPQRIV